VKLIRIYPEFGQKLKEGEFSLHVNDNGTAVFTRMCPGGRRECGNFLIRGEPDQANQIHGWDGNEEEPTIVPSLNCDRNPRCTHHYSVIAGVAVPF
jgi:hypothetical protein